MLEGLPSGELERLHWRVRARIWGNDS